MIRLLRNPLWAAGLSLLGQTSHAQITTAPVQGIVENPSRWHALTHATVLVDPGASLTNATVIIRDGLIVAVGEDLAVPAGAREWDLSGATVLPGLIDAVSNLGVPAEWLPPPAPKPGSPPVPPAAPAGSSEGAPYWNDFITPQRRVAERFQPDPERAGDLRELGFATVNALPQWGVLRGTSAVVNLNDRPSGNAWLVAADALQVGAFQYRPFPTPGYPTSLMGAIALLRQALYDARWTVEAELAYARNPALPRAEANNTLEALVPVVEGNRLLLLLAEDELDYQRAVNLADEFSIAIALLGNGYEYRRADYLADQNLAVVIPLGFPAAPEVERPEMALEVTLETLQHWELAPSNGAFLENAGVEFSFTSAGLDEPASEFWPAVRQAVKRGLPQASALAALTTRPAALLGIEDRLGSVKAGRIANLAVFSANPFSAADAKLRATWVDGQRFPAKDAEKPDPAGTWRVDSPAALAGELVISEEKSKLKATLNGGKDFSARIADRRVLLFPPAPGADAAAPPLRLSAALLGDTLQGLGQRPDGTVFRFVAARILPGGGQPEQDEEFEPPPAPPNRYPAGAFGVAGLPDEPADLIVRDATLWTATEDGVLEAADLWIRRGRIRAVGTDLKAPRGAVQIDASGKHVTPGIIDAHSHTAISRGVNEIGAAITVEVRIGDVIDPTDIAIYRELAGGVTAANLLHGSANPMGGQNQVIKLRWGGDADTMKFADAKPGVKFALGENVKQSNFGDSFITRYPQTRMGVREIMEDTFERARAYEKTWQQRNRDALPPRRNLRLDAVLEILNAERIVHIHSYRQDEILMFARLAADWGLAVGTFQHALEGYKVADAIAEIGAGGSTFSDWWGYKMEVYDAIPHNTALMHRAGVVTSVNSDSNELARRLNLEAAKAVKYGGLSEVEALATVTINPARQLRIDERTGSLETGKDADFLIWSGHPLSVYSRVEQTFIDGRAYFDRQTDQAAQTWAQAERERLTAKALAERLAKPDAKPAGAKPPPDMRGVDTPPEPEHEHHDHSHRTLYHDGSEAYSCALEAL